MMENNGVNKLICQGRAFTWRGAREIRFRGIHTAGHEKVPEVMHFVAEPRDIPPQFGPRRSTTMTSVPVLGQPRLPGSLPGDRLSKRIDSPPGSLKRATSISWFDLPGFGDLKRSWNWVKRCYAITIESVTKWFIEIYLRNQICRGWIQILGLG